MNWKKTERRKSRKGVQMMADYIGENEYERYKSAEEYTKSLRKRSGQLKKEGLNSAGEFLENFTQMQPFDLELANLIYTSDFLENFSERSLKVCEHFLQRHATTEWYMLLCKVFEEKEEVEEYHMQIMECYDQGMSPGEVQEGLDESRSPDEFRGNIRKKPDKQLDENGLATMEVCGEQSAFVQFLEAENQSLEEMLKKLLQERAAVRKTMKSLYNDNIRLKGIITSEHMGHSDPEDVHSGEENNQEKQCIQDSYEIPDEEKENIIPADFDSKTQEEQENLIRVFLLEKEFSKEKVRIVNKALMQSADDFSRYELYKLLLKSPDEQELKEFCGTE